MFEVILSIIGLAFASWTFLGNAAKEQVRAKIALNRDALLSCLSVSVVLAVLYPVAQSALPSFLADYEGWILVSFQILIISTACRAGNIVYPSGRWNVVQLAQFERRMERLVLNHSASVVVDVLSQAMPEGLPTRGSDSPLPNNDYFQKYESLVHKAFWHQEFVRSAVVQNRSFLAILMSKQNASGMKNSNSILHELMFGKDRILVRELALCTNFSNDLSQHFYRIPDDCIVLHALFDHIVVAREIHAWKPIGEGVLRYISSIKHTQSADIEQLPFFDGEEAEDAVWKSEIGSSIWFFRIMATSAALQGEIQHMWIPYLRYFIRGMEANLVIPKQTSFSEYPNRYCCWIQDSYDCCEEVISMASKIDEQNSNYPKLNQASGSTIIITSLQVYGECLKLIFQSKKLPHDFKNNAAHSLCVEYEKWCSHGFPKYMPEFAIKHMADGLKPEDKKLIAKFVDEVIIENPGHTRFLELSNKMKPVAGTP